MKTKRQRIYFIKGKESTLIKIGSTDNVKNRLMGMQTGSPEVLEVLATVPFGLIKEKDLHRRFAADRVHGEWFNPSNDLLNFIHKCKDNEDAFELINAIIQLLYPVEVVENTAVS